MAAHCTCSHCNCLHWFLFVAIVILVGGDTSTFANSSSLDDDLASGDGMTGNAHLYARHERQWSSSLLGGGLAAGSIVLASHHNFSMGNLACPQMTVATSRTTVVTAAAMARQPPTGGRRERLREDSLNSATQHYHYQMRAHQRPLWCLEAHQAAKEAGLNNIRGQRAVGVGEHQRSTCGNGKVSIWILSLSHVLCALCVVAKRQK